MKQLGLICGAVSKYELGENFKGNLKKKTPPNPPKTPKTCILFPLKKIIRVHLTTAWSGGEELISVVFCSTTSLNTFSNPLIYFSPYIAGT